MASKAKLNDTPDAPTILDTMNGPLGDSFEGTSWDGWRVILKAAYALPMTDDELAYFAEVGGGRAPPKKRVRELWCVGGRRGGKDSIASLIMAHAASLFNGKRRHIAGITLPALRRGERATIFCFGKDRDQARIALGYVKDYFQNIPQLKRMVTRETRDGFELSNGVDIIVATNDFRGIRGRPVLAAVLDECAFYKDENSASPDSELYAALKPGILTLIDQAMIIGISTPHKKSGLLWEKFQENYGKNDDDVLVIRGTSMQLNPTLPAEVIEAEIAKDPELNRAEYLCEWRNDISSFVMPEIVDAAIIKGCRVLPPSNESYNAFIDVSGGVNDSHTCAIAYRDEDGIAVLACAHEIKSADTEAVVAEISSLLKQYGVKTAFADRYGAEWVRNAFARHGVTLVKSPFDRSTIYKEAIGPLNANKIRLLDLPRLRTQLLALERQTKRGTGKDVIDHPTGGADDLCNAALGAVVMSNRERRQMILMAAGPNDGPDSPAIDYAQLYREQEQLAEQWDRDHPNDARNIDQYSWPISATVRGVLERVTGERKPKKGTAYKAVMSFPANVTDRCAFVIGHMEDGELVIDTASDEIDVDKAKAKVHRYTNDVEMRTDCIDAPRDCVSYLVQNMTGVKQL